MKKIVLIVMIMVIGSSLAFAGELDRRVYIVKKGDKPLDIIVTLSVVAQTSPEKILEWNSDLGLHNIHIGQKVQYYVNTGLEKKIDQETEKVSFQIDQKTEKIRLQISQLENKLNQDGAAKAIKTAEASLGINLKNIRGQIKDSSDAVLTKIDQTGNQLKNLFFIGCVVFLSMFIIVIVLFFVMARKNTRQKQLDEKDKFFQISINGKKYLYSPKKVKNKYLSLFRKLQFEFPQDAVKSSIGILKKSQDIFQQEIDAGRLKLKI